MNPAILQNLFSYILVVGMILTCLGTIGYRHYSKRVDQKKEQVATTQTEKLTEQNKELIAGKDELLAQNKTLRKELAQRDENLKEIALKDIYKPLSPILRQQLIDSLRQIKKPKEIIISDMNTNNGGKKVVSDLIDIFKEAGINTRRGSTGTAFGTSVISPQIKVNENLRLMAEQLHKILSLYVKTGFTGKFDDSLDEGVINIIIRGVPLFHQDGTIEFN